MPVRRTLALPPWGARNPDTEPDFEIPEGHSLVETDKRVEVGPHGRGHRLRWRAQREADRDNARRQVPSYRYAVVDTGARWPRPRWMSVPFQNVLVPDVVVPMKEDTHG